ncbi:MAG: hypothetical protein Q9225_004655 [Loekoesia sp. 1 TL-2023]
MLFRRTAISLSRRAAFTPVSRHTFATSRIRREDADPKRDIKRDPEQKHHRLDPIPGQTEDMIPFDEVKTSKDLLPPGAAPGTIPTDLEQATGLERLEILGKMQGIDVFDMKPLDASRLGNDAFNDQTEPTPLSHLPDSSQVKKVDSLIPLLINPTGTLDDPIMVKSFGDEQYAGCTGFPADSHSVLWNTLSRTHPVSRCRECGSVYKMEYIGPPDDPHDHHGHHGYEEPKTWADFVRPEYRDGR